MCGRIIMLGSACVGKTSIINQFINKSFNEHEVPSIGQISHCVERDLDGETLQVQIWDTSGQEKYRSLGPLFYRQGDLAVAVFDVTDEQSFKGLGEWIQAFVKCQENSDAPIFVVGNKIDLAERVVSFEEASDWASSQTYHFFEVSAKTGNNIEMLLQSILKELRDSKARKRVPETVLLDIPEIEPLIGKKCC